MNSIAIIPARGGSKRIPRKNIKNFAGKPIVAYSIETAIASQLFDKVIVSTDDEEIKSVAEGSGAEVPFLRPKRLADDYTGTNDVTKHAIQWCWDNNYPIKYACCIYATAPFLQAKYLQQGFEKLVNSAKSFVFSATSFSFPIQRAIRIESDDSVIPFFPEYISERSQDLEESFHDAGQFYWGTSNAFVNNAFIYSPNSSTVILPRYLVQDIDTIEDWYRAELMYHAWKSSGGRL